MQKGVKYTGNDFFLDKPKRGDVEEPTGETPFNLPEEMVMKKLELTCSLFLALVCFTAPARAAAEPDGGQLCFKFVNFCDGIQVNSIVSDVINSEWYHFDCVNNFPMTGGSKGEDPITNNCLGPDGSGLIECVGCGGDYYFVIDAPLDGSLDFHTGLYPNGLCAGDDLAYNLLLGPCIGLKQPGQRALGQDRSSVQ